MAEQDTEMTVIWPIYMDSTKTRNEGRKISVEDAVSEPRLNEVYNAALSLKMQAIKHQNPAYPGEWYNKSGRILVKDDNLTKLEIIKRISSEIKTSRKNKKNANRNSKKKRKR